MFSLIYSSLMLLVSGCDIHAVESLTDMRQDSLIMQEVISEFSIDALLKDTIVIAYRVRNGSKAPISLKLGKMFLRGEKSELVRRLAGGDVKHVNLNSGEQYVTYGYFVSSDFRRSDLKAMYVSATLGRFLDCEISGAFVNAERRMTKDRYFFGESLSAEMVKARVPALPVIDRP